MGGSLLLTVGTEERRGTWRERIGCDGKGQVTLDFVTKTGFVLITWFHAWYPVVCRLIFRCCYPVVVLLWSEVIQI